MKLFKKLAAALLAISMVASLAACGSSSGSASAASEAAKSEAPAAAASEAAKPEAPAAAASEAAGSAAAPAGDVDVNAALKGKTIGYVTINSASPWSGCIDSALGQLVQDAGATYRNLDAQTDTAKVAEYCQQMIDANVDALVIFGGDPSANSDIAKTADEAGIPVFMAALDVSENGKQYVKACVGPDQEQMCYEIGQYIIEQNGADAGCKVVQISGVPFLDDYIQREAGFARAMKDTNYELIPAVPIQAIGAVGQGCRLAVLTGDIREAHIHALQHGKGVIRRTGGVGQLGQHFFLGSRQAIGPLTVGILQNVMVFLELRQRHPGIQGLLGDREDLWIYKAQRRGQRHIQAHGPALQPLRLGVAVVAGFGETCIEINQLHLLGGGINLIKTGFETFGGLLQGALQRAQLLHGLFCLGEGCFPCLGGLKYIAELPLEAGVHVFAVFQCHNYTSFP